jgi:Na+-driven multidrug efflux pump
MIIYSITVARLGTVAFATHQICFNIQAMSFMTGMAFGVSATSLVGQSLGKKRPDMAHLYAARTRRVGMVFAVFLGLIFFFFGRQIVGLYTDDQVIIDLGGSIMMMMAFMMPFQSSQFILAGALRGAGDTKTTAIIVLVSVMIIRPLVAVATIEYWELGLWGAWIALAADQALRSLLVWLRFISGKWKAIKV